MLGLKLNSAHTFQLPPKLFGNTPQHPSWFANQRLLRRSQLCLRHFPPLGPWRGLHAAETGCCVALG
jgi:hypothetical protein